MNESFDCRMSVVSAIVESQGLDDDKGIDADTALQELDVERADQMHIAFLLQKGAGRKLETDKVFQSAITVGDVINNVRGLLSSDTQK